MTTSWGLLTLTTVATGNFTVGGILTGTGVTAGTQITAYITGTGGSGTTAAVNISQTASSGTLTESSAIETDWVAASSAPAGGLVKITRWQP